MSLLLLLLACDRDAPEYAFGGGEATVALSALSGVAPEVSLTVPGLALEDVEALAWTTPACMDESFFFLQWSGALPSDAAGGWGTLTLCVAVDEPAWQTPWDEASALELSVTLPWAATEAGLPGELEDPRLELIAWDAALFDAVANGDGRSEAHLGLPLGRVDSDTAGALDVAEIDWWAWGAVGDCSGDCQGLGALQLSWDADPDVSARAR